MENLKIDPSVVVPVNVVNQTSAGTGLLATCILTNLPIGTQPAGTVKQYSNIQSVLADFPQAGSNEVAVAQVLFNGTNTSFRTTPYIYIMQVSFTSGSTTVIDATTTVNNVLAAGSDIAVIIPANSLGDAEATDTYNLNFFALAGAVSASITANKLLAFFAYDYAYSATTSVGRLTFAINTALYSGTACFYEPQKNSLTCALAATVFSSQDYTQLNNATTVDFKNFKNATVPSNVTVLTDTALASSFLLNGLNFFGNYKISNNSFNFLQPGAISPFSQPLVQGAYSWIDNLMSAIWIERNIQLAVFNLFTTVQQEPNSSAGYGIIKGVVGQALDQAKTVGIIVTGVDLSSYAAQFQTLYGIDVAVLSNNGWYIIANPATAVQRANRTAGQWTILYVKGNAIQTLPINIQQLN